jgi:hypothetical protein
MKSIGAVLMSSFDLEDAIKIGSLSSPPHYSFNGCLINQILILQSNPERLEFVLFHMTTILIKALSAWRSSSSPLLTLKDALIDLSLNIDTNLECLKVVLLSSLDLEGCPDRPVP